MNRPGVLAACRSIAVALAVLLAWIGGARGQATGDGLEDGPVLGSQKGLREDMGRWGGVVEEPHGEEVLGTLRAVGVKEPGGSPSRWHPTIKFLAITDGVTLPNWDGALRHASREDLRQVIADETAGVVAFRSGWESSDPDAEAVWLTVLESGTHHREGVERVGHLTLRGGGRDWLVRQPIRDDVKRSDPRWIDREAQNAMQVVAAGMGTQRAAYPIRAGRIDRLRGDRDGSGSVGILYGPFSENGIGEKPLPARGDPFTGGEAWRTLGVDYSGNAGGPVLLVLMDTIIDIGPRQRVWQAHLGDVPGYSHAMVAAGYGLLYQLTGDPRDAGRSQLLVEAALYTPHAYGEHYGPPMFLLGTAIAYDLWYDAWDPDFRELVQLYLERNIREIATLSVGPDPLRLGEAEYVANAMPLSERGSTKPHWGAHLRAAAALAALSVMNDPISLPEPVSPEDAQSIKPAENYEPWVGVPIVPFTNNNMPAAWLINGPFYRTPRDPDPLSLQGGVAAARPEPGQRLPSSDGSVDWRAFHPAGSGNPPDPTDPLVVKIYPRTDARYWAYSGKMGGYLNATRIHPTAPGQRAYTYLYTVIDNDRDRVVQALPNRGSTGRGVRMFLNGTELRDGDVARLSPGLYPMMLEIPARGGYSNQAPRLTEYTLEKYARDMFRYKIGHDAHAAAGGHASRHRRLL